MYSTLRALRQDPSVLQQRIKPGTLRRTLTIAAPYSCWLLLLAVVVIANASISIVNPLIYRRIINDGILRANTAPIVHLALFIALLGLLDAALGSRSAAQGQGWSMTIANHLTSGEGINNAQLVLNELAILHVLRVQNLVSGNQCCRNQHGVIERESVPFMDRQSTLVCHHGDRFHATHGPDGVENFAHFGHGHFQFPQCHSREFIQHLSTDGAAIRQ